jgi:O-antigen ligase
LFTTLATMPFSMSFPVSLPRLIGQILEYWLLFFLVISQVRSLAEIRRIVVGVAAVIGCASLMGLFEAFTGKNLYRDVIFSSRAGLWDWPAGLYVPGTGLARVLGPFEHPIALGVTFAMALPLIIWLLQTERRPAARVVLFGLIFTVSFCILASVSRLAWISGAAALLVSTAMSWKKRLIVLLALVAVGFFPMSIISGRDSLSVAQLLIQSFDISRPAEGLNQSAIGRLQLIGNSIDMIRQRLWFGYGLSITKTLYETASGTTVWAALQARVGTLENQYLVYFVDLGLVGGIPWLLLQIAVGRSAWKMRTRFRDLAAGDPLRLLGPALCGSLVAYLVSLLGVGGYYQQIDPFYWILVGLMVVAWRLYNDRRFTAAKSIGKNA